MARRSADIKPTSPLASIGLMLLSVLAFIVGLWVVMAVTRVVLG